MIRVHGKSRAPDYLLNFLFCLPSDSESLWSDGSETKLLGLTYTKSGFVPELVAQWEECSICTKSQETAGGSLVLALKEEKQLISMLPPKKWQGRSRSLPFPPSPHGRHQS